MSYKEIVLKDDPVAYWPLTGSVTYRTYANILQEYQTYQQWLTTELDYAYDPGSFTFQDVSVNNNHAALAFGTQLPLFQNVTTLNARLFSDTNYNGCKITDSSVISIFDIYNFFNKGYEEGIFNIEFWVQFPQFPSTNVNLFSVINQSSKEILSRVDIEKDYIYFIVYDGSSQYITKKRIYSFDQKMHILLTYSERSIKISVNGVSDETVSLPDTFQFPTVSDTYVNYTIGPASPTKFFVINDLSFYSKNLSYNQILSHITAGSIDSNPEYFSQQTNASHIDIIEKPAMIHYQKKFSVASDYNQGIYNNIIPDKNGITIPMVTNRVSGDWYYNVPISQVSEIVGASISWDSASSPYGIGNDQYASVSISWDGGNDFQEIYSNQVIPDFLNYLNNNPITGNASTNFLIHVRLQSVSTDAGTKPRIDNLTVTLYKSLDIAADSGGFVLSPATNQTYTVNKNNLNILSKGSNLGLYFSNQTSVAGVPGYAVINSVNNTPYSTVEFWFRYDGVGNAITYIDGDGSSNLSINPDGTLWVNETISMLFVNGIQYAGAVLPITVGETYHFVVVYGGQHTSNLIINNADPAVYPGITPSQASYGYITFYPNQLTQADAQNRYLSYLATENSIVNDGSTIGTISEYFGSTITSINGGVPVIAHNHIS